MGKTAFNFYCSTGTGKDTKELIAMIVASDLLKAIFGFATAFPEWSYSTIRTIEQLSDTQTVVAE